MKKLLAASLVLFSVPALIVLRSTPAHATDTYKLDPVHTQIIFSVSHLGFSHSHGMFKKFEGSFTLDEQKPENSSAQIVIDTNSLEMGTPIWNEHTQAKFLNGDKFPQIAFKSTKVTRTGEKTADLAGDLTLHGVTKPVTLHATLNGLGQHPMMMVKAAGFELTGTIKRSDFGISDLLPMIGDDVALEITAEGTVTPQAAESAANK